MPGMDAINATALMPAMIAHAMAPVFLIAGIAGFLNVISTRLGRAVDRLRAIDAHTRSHPGDDSDILAEERIALRLRIARAYVATGACVASALCICVVVILIFLNPLTRTDLSTEAGWCFVVAMVLLGIGLIAFISEMRIAVRAPRTGIGHHQV